MIPIFTLFLLLFVHDLEGFTISFPEHPRTSGPNENFSIPVTITNTSSEEEDLIIVLEENDFFQNTFLSNHELHIAPFGVEILLISGTVAEKALENNEELSLLIEDRKGVKTNFKIPLEVAKREKISLSFQEFLPFVPATETITVKAYVTNEGNTPQKLALFFETSPARITNQLEWMEIAPFTTKEVFFFIETSPFDNSDLFIALSANNCCGTLTTKVSQILHLVPTKTEYISLTHKIPSRGGLYLFEDTGKKAFGVELLGQGPISSQSLSELSYFFRVPSDTHLNIYGFDQRLRVSIDNPDWRGDLGDAYYVLSPLTERSRLLRGIGASHWGSTWQLHAFSAQEPYGKCSKLTEGGFLIGRKLRPNLLVSTQSFFRDEAIIASLRGQHWKDSLFFLDAEWAFNCLTSNNGKLQNAFFGKLEGKLLSNGWYSIEESVATQKFNGFINNLNLTSASLNLPIRSAARFSLFATRLERTRIKPSLYTPPAPDQKQCGAHLSYFFRSGFNVVSGYNYFSSKDQQNDSFDFHQSWANLDISRNFPHFNALFSFNLGSITDEKKGERHDFLQRYYTYLFSNRDRVQGFLLCETGQLNYFTPNVWRSTFSLGGKVIPQNGSFASLAWSLDYRHKRRAVAERFSLVLEHDRITFRGDYFYNKRNSYHDRWYAMISYTVPFDLPFGRRKDIGKLEGQILSSGTRAPISYALVSSGVHRAMTDEEGRYQFYLPPGPQEVAVLQAPMGMEQETSDIFNVQPGCCQSAPLYLSPLSRVRGQVVFMQQREDLHSQTLLVEKGERSLERAALAHPVRIAIISIKNGMVLYTTTTKGGEFYIEDLPVGEWKLVPVEEDLPEGYCYERGETILKVAEGKENLITIAIVPR